MYINLLNMFLQRLHIHFAFAQLFSVNTIGVTMTLLDNLYMVSLLLVLQQ